MAIRHESPEPILLCPADLVGLLQLSRSHIYVMLASGEIPSIKVGRKRRILRSALDDWLNRRQGAA
jgi:excisionase family DNA binding protein